MRWVYISPHLDDAVLSAGGFIYEQTREGIPVEIWTIICGFPPPGKLTPFAQFLHTQWGAGSTEDIVRLRRQEDIGAASIVGAKCVHFNVPDCIYRRGPDGEALYLDIYAPPHKAEAGLFDQIVKSIAPLLKPGDRLICQLGVGGHVDHIIVREAVERLGVPIWFTADIPYLFKKPEDLSRLTAGMRESTYPITEAGMQAWFEGILAYQSQLTSLFDGQDKMVDEIRSFYAERQGFPVWERVSRS